MKTFRELVVWQKSMDLSVEIYNLTNSFPQSEEYGLSSQVRRSSVSVPSNIAEGYGRNHTKDFVRFLQIAQGSVYECQTQLEIAYRVNYLIKDDFDNIDARFKELAKMLSSLIRKVNESTTR